MNRWSDCIVVFMDLIGTKKRALEGNRTASTAMRSFHKLVRREMNADLRSLDHAYVWNDSVLLLAYVDDRLQTYENAMRAADELKQRVDATTQCFAIAVKGRAFPSKTSRADSRVTLIRASSYAMANCFRIEAQATAQKLRYDWYVDVRIARKVRQARASKWIDVAMLPSGKRRRVYAHDGYLWSALTCYQ